MHPSRIRKAEGGQLRKEMHHAVPNHQNKNSLEKVGQSRRLGVEPSRQH